MSAENSYKPAGKSKVSGLATAYLVLYNVVLCAGWLSVGAMGVRHYLQEKTNVGLYDAIELPLKAFQTAAILEVVHCLIGIVPSSAVLTAFQVTSRLVLLWPVTHSVIQVQNEKSIILYVMAWTITEVIRYAFYVFALLNRLPYVLMWLRYTLFIVLYPIGVTGELWTIYLALPYVKSTGLYSLELPNDYNISFDYYSVLIFLMILYIPIFPRLYSHMLRQRKKMLTGKPGAKRD
ncbi:very-long-chain (3R)-3-hydroxyacyl-CoA dehydratase 2-like [Diadema setosum]|uniref:very-long-chain (3R)-3-hydroxyacyl-CoA dehydratase 2-like n=1 Tax=Diadema setosum TaxID=31175 RepID=UPI003B3BBFFE